MRGIFVTGTDTGIGKTVVSAAMINAFRETESVCYWKPIQTGIEEDDDTSMVNQLAMCSDKEIHLAGIRLKRPLSPHLSARLSGSEISIEKTLAYLGGNIANRFWIVEGAGGIQVPINDSELMIDLIKAIQLPALIVARSGLGTINHTLLTLESLRLRGIEIFGVVMNGEQNLENKKAIEHYGRVSVLAEMPKFEKLNAEDLSRWGRENKIWQSLRKEK
ncbi:MAG: dethiobiotin synthase [Acidobacteria bacterium]|nr:dethiobiotin synthase [Acidobacteriota bacterium]